MDTLPILLVLLSTFMHAAWNLLGKRQDSVHLFFRQLLRSALLLGLLPALAAELLLPSLPLRALLCAIGSSFFCASYYFSLASAYDSGDFTIVYPMARAIPVILVGIADVLLGRPPSPLGWLGMVLVVLGCIIAPLPSLGAIHWSHYGNRTQMWVWFTAFSTTGYTLLDKWASEAVPGGFVSAMRYGYLFFAGTAVVYEGMLRLFRRSKSEGGPGWKQPAIAANFNFWAYALVLWAYQLSQHAGYIVAFRQFSIVIGVVLGLLLLHERHGRIRLLAASTICVGLITIGVWG